MKKRRLGLFVMLLVILCIPIRVETSAATGSRATGASIPIYREVVVRRLDGADISQGLLEALTEAEEYATDEKQYKIVIAPGLHRLGPSDGASAPYYIPSNVWISARGAIIDTTCKKMFMTRPNGKGPYRNIRIEGGMYRQSRDAENVTARMPLRLSHVRNMEIRDVSLLMKRRTHLLEMANGINVTIRGCTFSGNNWGGNFPTADYVQPKEAVQIDAATEAAIPDHPPYDGMGSHNVLVCDNTFVNVARGVGSHNNGTEVKSYTDITISGNKFLNLTGEAVHGMHWQNATITGNTIVNGRHAGILLSDCGHCRVADNEISGLKPYVGLRKAKYGYFGGIIMSATTSNCVIKNNVLSGSTAKVVVRKTQKMLGNSISGNKKV